MDRDIDSENEAKKLKKKTKEGSKNQNLPPFQQEIFDESTPIYDFLSTIGLGFLHKTLTSSPFFDGKGI